MVDKAGGSALVYACKEGRAQTALALLAKGAQLDHILAGGATALDFCAGKASMLDVAVAIRSRGGRLAAEVKARAAN